MKKVLFLCIVVFLISGCEMPQDSAVKSAGDSRAAIESPISTIESTTTAEAQKIAVDSNQVKVEAVVLPQEKEAVVIRNAEEIIKENRWGFSIYDPQTGIVEYYASKGGYLGKKSLN